MVVVMSVVVVPVSGAEAAATPSTGVMVDVVLVVAAVADATAAIVVRVHPVLLLAVVVDKLPPGLDAPAFGRPNVVGEVVVMRLRLQSRRRHPDPDECLRANESVEWKCSTFVR